MGFFKIGNRKGKGPDESGKPVQAAQPDNGANEKQRLKKIKNMCGKFNETVRNSVMDVMTTDMPQFVMVGKDGDGNDAKKFVLLGFDTKIVDDFSNKSDEDVGSLATAIKSSMDCVVEEALLGQELILMLPTARTLAALKEFEETFDLKFYVTYVTPEWGMSMETASEGSNERITVTLGDIESMLADGVYVGDMIEAKKSGASEYDPNDITAPEDEPGDEPGDESGNEPGNESGNGDEPKDEPGDENEPGDGGDGPESDGDNGGGRGENEVKGAVNEAVKNASRVAGQVSEQKNETDTTPNDGGNEQPEEGRNDGGSDSAKDAEGGTQARSGAAAEAADKISKLKDAVQKASDEALENTDVKDAKANINPQARAAAFDMAAMDQYITRKYYSDDLELEITSEPFDAMFMQSNPYVPFTELDEDTWLSGYVNNLRRDANTRMAKLHYENIMLMRERYMLIIMKHCETITKSVSTDDPKSRFGYALGSIKKIHDDDVAKIAEKSEEYKRECEQAYQNRMEAVAKNAAAAARAQFENAYKADHDRELKDIETDLRNNIESEYVSAVENLKNSRRQEAKRQLDAGISEALKLCADEYTKMLAMERKEYGRLQKVISDFQNDNMAAEQARVLALAEEQRRENEVVKVRREYDSKYELANREFEAKLASVKADMERASLEHANYIDELREQHENMMQGLRDAQKEQLAHKETEIQMLSSQLKTANDQIETLTQKYVELDSKTEQKYATQTDMLRSERDAWTGRAEQVERLHKYTDKIKLTAMIVAIIAALGLGIIFGCAIVANTYNNQEKAPIINYIDGNRESGESEDADPGIEEPAESGTDESGGSEEAGR